MYTRHKQQTPPARNGMHPAASTTSSHQLSQGALSYLNSLQQSSKALRDGQEANELSKTPHRSTTTHQYHESGRAVTPVQYQQSCATEDKLLNEAKSADIDELSQLSSISDISSFAPIANKRTYASSAGQMHLFVSDSDVVERTRDTKASTGDGRADMNTRQNSEMIHKLAGQFSDQLSKESVDRRASIGQADTIRLQKALLGTHKYSTVSSRSTVRDYRLKNIRKSIDLSLNSPSYVYEFDSDTSSNSLVTVNSKGTPKTPHTLQLSNQAVNKVGTTKTSPFKRVFSVLSGSSSQTNETEDEEAESILELVHDDDTTIHNVPSRPQSLQAVNSPVFESVHEKASSSTESRRISSSIRKWTENEHAVRTRSVTDSDATVERHSRSQQKHSTSATSTNSNSSKSNISAHSSVKSNSSDDSERSRSRQSTRSVKKTQSANNKHRPNSSSSTHSQVSTTNTRVNRRMSRTSHVSRANHVSRESNNESKASLMEAAAPVAKRAERLRQAWHKTSLLKVPKGSGGACYEPQAMIMSSECTKGDQHVQEAAFGEYHQAITPSIKHDYSEAVNGSRTNEEDLLLPGSQLHELVKRVVHEVVDGHKFKFNSSPQLTDSSVQTDSTSRDEMRAILNTQLVLDNLKDKPNVMRVHLELLGREADRERRALREWNSIMRHFEQRCHLHGFNRLKTILNSAHPGAYL